MSKALCGTFALVCAVSAVASAEIIVVDSAIHPDSGHTYYVVRDTSNRNEGIAWLDAEAYAVATWNAHLARITSAEENQWLVDTFESLEANLFIGLTDQDQEGTFVWIDTGGPIAAGEYDNWGSGEPNDHGDGEDFSALMINTRKGDWNDCGNDAAWEGPYYGLIEVVPEPASLTALAIGAVALLRRRR